MIKFDKRLLTQQQIYKKNKYKNPKKENVSKLISNASILHITMLRHLCELIQKQAPHTNRERLFQNMC